MLKYELSFSRPLMNAAGTLGFAPDARLPVDLEQFGAFITNPISLKPRVPAHARSYLPFPGGFLLHSAHPNPGMREVLRRYAARWSRSSLPVIVNLLAREMREVASMIERLESIEGVIAVELGIPPDAGEDLTYALVSAVVGELPLIAQLPVASASQLADAAMDAGANALSLSAPRGALPDLTGKYIAGRLYGPSLFPHTMLALQTLMPCDLPVIVAGGIYHADQVQVALDAGAAAVQVDAVLWRGGW